MSSPAKIETDKPIDLSTWRKAPNILLAVGAIGAVIGAFVNTRQFGASWLLAFMFFLSLCLGGLFLVLVHHLFDASWSTPIRRVNENLACLLPVMAVLFIPIAILAPKLYPWMQVKDVHADHALHAKLPLFTLPGFYLIVVFCFLTWWFLSTRLRAWSLKQDETGSAECTYRMRALSCVGIFLFGTTLTLGAIMWMKALQHQWFSTMYGVYYFAGSVWTTLATVYMIVYVMKRNGPLRNVIKPKQFYFLGSLFFAFTVFYAYVTFSQYFIIWNGNMPEETFWYSLREQGSWWDIGLIIIFGHFFLPFLLMLRIDAKLTVPLMAFLCVWAWLMHFLDLSFNIMPVFHPQGYVLHWIDICCWAFMAGLLSKLLVKNIVSHPPYPQRDPRMAEGLDAYVPATIAPAAAAATARNRSK